MQQIDDLKGQSEDNGLRRSTRDIKRPKFDDEIVQSVPILNKVLLKRRTLQSPDYEDPMSASKFGVGKKRPSRQSWDNDNSHREDVSLSSESPDEKVVALSDRKRKERIQAASKVNAFNQQKSAAKIPSTSDNEMGLALSPGVVTEMMRNWTVQDDILLITSVTHLCDLNVVHTSTRFSKPFTVDDIDSRWYGILYDESVNQATMDRIEALPQEQILEIQSTIPFSTEEEEIIASIGSCVSPPSGAFETLLEQHSGVFHHSRTPIVLDQHWKYMKQWGLLVDQTMQVFDEELLKMERDYDMNRIVPDDILLPTDVDQHNFVNNLQTAMIEANEWEKVRTRAVVGIAQPTRMDVDTLAVLKGKCVSFDIRKDRVVIGRCTQKHRVDVNLTYEGPSASISRRQCFLYIDPNGRTFLNNIGTATVYVDRRLVPRNSRVQLHNSSLVEIGLIRLVFIRNDDLFHMKTDSDLSTEMK